MKDKDLYDALSGIDEKYLSNSENFSEISAAFKRDKLRKIGVISSFCGSALIIAIALSLNSNRISGNQLNTMSELMETSEIIQTDIFNNSNNTDHSDVSVTENKMDNQTTTEKNNNKTENTTKSNNDTTTVSNKDTENPTKNPDNVSQTSNKPSGISGYYTPFPASVNPYIDAYDPNDDGIHSVDIMIDGMYYTQLSSYEYINYIITSSVSESDFGDFIGNIVETDNYNTNCYVASKEPKLSGAEVYYYAPAGNKTVIIVKQGEQCSIFKASARQLTSLEGVYLSFAETLGYYGAETSADIESISYTISVPNGSLYVVSAQGTISDSDTINSIIDVLNSLSPETDNTSTPQWQIDAWAEYRANPSAYNAENIIIEINLKNGTVISDIMYQPFLANGYVSGMQQLTAEQNVMLRSFF